MKINWVPHKNINNIKTMQLLNDTVESGQFTNYGPNVQRLEKFIRKKLQIIDQKAVICVNNGSSALHALIAAIEDYHNSSVNWATQSFTFPPSAQGRLNTLIIDIDKDGGIDLEKVPDHVNGIIITNIFGNVVDIDKYTQWSKINNKFVIYDNAASAFTFYKGLNSCNYGHGSTISFHHTKPIGFGEGGAIIVDKKYEPSVRRMINFGLDANTLNWHRDASNYKMSDIAAVYILQYLESFDNIIVKHYELYDKMVELLKGTDIKLYPNFSDEMPFVSCFCLLSDDFTAELVTMLLDKGIFCRKYYRPLKNTAMAKDIYNKILCLPCNVDMTTMDVEEMIKILLQCVFRSI